MAILQAAFDAYLADLWQYAQDIHRDAARCNTGLHCRYGKPYQMTLVEPSAHDVQLLREITINKLLPEWGEKCQQVHPGCLDEWREKLSPWLDSPQNSRALP